MTFQSILFNNPEDHLLPEPAEAPACFADLNLDQLIDTITAGRQDYQLRPFFYTPLKDVETITYRHEIMRDLENKKVFEQITAFAHKLRAMRDHLAQAPLTSMTRLWYVLSRKKERDEARITAARLIASTNDICVRLLYGMMRNRW